MSLYLSKLNKPEYYWKCRGLFRKSYPEQDGYSLVRTAFGTKFRVASADAIGIGIKKTGVHELAVSEALWRLTQEGDLVVDAGANHGFFTQLLSARAGQRGRVVSFEPNDKILPLLYENVGLLGGNRTVEIIEAALSNSPGKGIIRLPDGYQINSGIAQVLPAHGQDTEDAVAVTTLDTIFGRNSVINVLKIDVEGAEKQVLEGAVQLLSMQKIRFIVFEDFNVFPTEVTELLKKFGYHSWRLEKGWTGPILQPGKARLRNSSWDSINYVASTDQNALKRIFIPPGYHCLRSP